MATQLTPVVALSTGVNPGAYAAAAAGGNYFANTGREVLILLNGGSQITVTIATYGKVQGLSFAAQALTALGSGAEKWFGPFLPWVYNDPSGFVQVSYSDVTTVTVVVVQMPVLT